jgi:hypothetical protein
VEEAYWIEELKVEGETSIEEVSLPAGQKLSYHCQYFLSSSLVQVSWIHWLTAEFPQSSSFDWTPAAAKHCSEQSVVADGIVLEAERVSLDERLLEGTAASLEWPVEDGYG